MPDVILLENNIVNVIKINEQSVVTLTEKEVQLIIVGVQGPEGVAGAKGDKGDDGDPASNIITSVNTQTGDVALTQDDIADGTQAKQFTLDEKNKLADCIISSDNSLTDAIKLTQAAYDLLTPVETTIYFIVG